MITREPDFNKCIYNFKVSSIEEKDWLQNHTKDVYDTFVERYFNNREKTNVHTFEEYQSFMLDPKSAFYGIHFKPDFNREEALETYQIQKICAGNMMFCKNSALNVQKIANELFEKYKEKIKETKEV